MFRHKSVTTVLSKAQLNGYVSRLHFAQFLFKVFKHKGLNLISKWFSLSSKLNKKKKIIKEALFPVQ